MRKISYIVTALIAAATLVLWAAGGFHTGWTQTRIPVHGVDEITGIEFTTYEDGFIAGLEVLAAGLGAAFGISAISTALHYFNGRAQG